MKAYFMMSEMEESQQVKHSSGSCECRACLLKAYVHLEEPEQKENEEEEELDNYDEVPCQGCGDSVPRDDVNQYRLGWWCSKFCAFYSVMY
jgi:hypothetical protein